MGVFSALNISASALSAERERSEVAVANLANVDTTRTEAGTGPYRRREVVLESSGSPFQSLLGTNGSSAPQTGGVRLTKVVEDQADPIRRYEPGHPDADKEGYVSYPAINPAQEMVDLMGSVRAYQLNASAISASKQMIEQSIDLLKS
ncbi:MAG TPA: flagellar basal body rod protein FlgC [Acidobacteriaceae bacterium]